MDETVKTDEFEAEVDYYLGLLVVGGAVELQPIETKKQKFSQDLHELNGEEGSKLRSNMIKLAAVRRELKQMFERGFDKNTGYTLRRF